MRAHPLTHCLTRHIAAHLLPHRVVGVRLKGVVWALELAKGAAGRPGGGGRVRPARPDDGPPRRARRSGVCERQVDKKAVRSPMHGRGPRWAQFLTFSVFLVDFCVFLLVLCHSRCPCACFKPLWAVRKGKGLSFLYFLSRVTGWARAEVGTFSDYFRLLGRICVFRLVLCHTALLGVRVHVSSPCERSEEVRGRHAITF